MKKVISTEKFPIKMWLENIEEGALDQAKNLANLPFAFKHVAIMPDAYLGYGMPIGAVLATKDVIIPNSVGVDVGCGAACCKLPITEITAEQIKQIFGGSKEYKGGIRSFIPVGFSHHSKKQEIDWMPGLNLYNSDSPIYDNFDSAQKQIGTLGGGNHFIEIQKGSDEHIYIMIHSGSRNLGFKVAKHYNEIAKELNKKWFSSVNPKWDLAFLPVDSDEGQSYISDMKYCVEFAKRSRLLMMTRCLEAFNTIFDKIYPESNANLYWDVAHNYATLEHHFGKNVWVHRKGATKAMKGGIGLIPGSQGTSSYIVEGLGNPDSFMSCSHGAGRLMSRTKAKAELNLENEIKKMEGIVHGIRNKNDLDEASGAYKNIDEVMENQNDLVKIKTKLFPLGVIKG
jgi:tRNA-splicing ligase RtcB (3'-phosphate/5'-hydroxy nucleic acid ligase)